MIFGFKKRNKINNSESIELLTKELEAVQLTSHQLMKQTDLNETLEIIVSILVKKLNYFNPSIYLLNEDASTFSIKKVNIPKIFINLAEKLIHKSIYEVPFSLNEENLLSESIKTGKLVVSNSMYDLLKPHINITSANILQKSISVKSIIVAPIKIDNIPIGCLALASKQNTVSKIELKVINTFSDQISIAIYNSQQSEKLKHQVLELENNNKDLSSLFNFARNISKTLDPDQVAQIAVNSLPQDDITIGGVLGLYDQEKHVIQTKTVTDNTISRLALEFTGDLEKYILNLNNTDHLNNPTAEAILTKTAQYSEDIPSYLYPALPKPIASAVEKVLNIKAVIVFPIMSHENVIGTIGYLLKKTISSGFSEKERQLLKTYSYQVGIALENANLYKKSKETQVVLQKALDQVQELRRQERDMIDVMGHELRTPITIVRNALLVLDGIKKASGKISDEVLDKYLEMAIESTRREITLIETLLSATKVDAHRIQLSKEKVDMLDVIHDSIEGNKNFAEEKSIEIQFEEPKNTTFFAYADRLRVQEVMDNLLNNAIKYTPKGYVKIEIKDLKHSIQIDVIDSGIGISREDIANLGKKFFRAKQYVQDDENKQKIVRPGGTGLGLYVVFGLVKGMGGKVIIDSEIGKGSTFSFALQKFNGQNEIKYEESKTNSKISILNIKNDTKD